MEDICLQCMEKCVGPSKRLVQDSCGHRKCRNCLLADVEKCKQCSLIEKKQNPVTEISTQVKCESGVIKCNENLSPKKTELPTTQNTTQCTKKLKKSNRSYKRINIPSHISINRDPLSYNCNICNKSFTTKAHVKYHTYCAQAVKPHKCEICNREFVLKTHFNVHMLKHKDGKVHTCNKCDKSFDERYKLNRHLLSHTNEKPYVCSDCGHAFRSRQSLRLHARIHKGEKPYACSLCSARFNHASNLKKHYVSHSGEKEHMCDVCGKTFKLKSTLSVHRKTHLPVRQFECGLCPKIFITNKELQRHSLTHIETKGFTCSICNTNFGRKDNLSRHMKNSHPGKKAEVIKNLVNKPSLLHRKRPVDNPNAVNVIKSPPSYTTRQLDTPVPNKSDTRSSTVITGPIKLAFKTPAFKNNYNIQRDLDYVPSPSSKKSYDLNDSVNIYQKILLPQSPPPSRNVDIETTPLSQKSLTTCTPLHYETSFQNRKHAMIKNIKFKVPIQYTQNSRMDDSQTFGAEPLKPVMVSEGLVNGTNNNSYTELKTINSTSVIVNASQPNNIHWRRRISQNLNLNC